jgi:hypothetical protein
MFLKRTMELKNEEGVSSFPLLVLFHFFRLILFFEAAAAASYNLCHLDRNRKGK